jgi:GntR family transcriptional regulator, arabinose operon transcriptional repressor
MKKNSIRKVPKKLKRRLKNQVFNPFKNKMIKPRLKLAGIFKSDDIQGHRRYAGYAEALLSAGATVNDDNVLWYTTENRESLINSCLMKTLEGCTGVVCYNDMITLQVLKVLSENGINVPEEIEPVSFDNSTFSAISGVQFKSLSNPKERLGSLAAQKMINLINGENEVSAVLKWE